MLSRSLLCAEESELPLPLPLPLQLVTSSYQRVLGQWKNCNREKCREVERHETNGRKLLVSTSCSCSCFRSVVLPSPAVSRSDPAAAAPRRAASSAPLSHEHPANQVEEQRSGKIQEHRPGNKKHRPLEIKLRLGSRSRRRRAGAAALQSRLKGNVRMNDAETGRREKDGPRERERNK